MVMGIVFLVVTRRVVGKAIDTQRHRGDADDKSKTKELDGLRKQLVERIENLETIVCGVDLELNQKLHKLLDEQKLLTTGAAAVVVPPAVQVATPPAGMPAVA